MSALGGDAVSGDAAGADTATLLRRRTRKSKKKLLFLGMAESGKSTIVSHMRSLCNCLPEQEMQAMVRLVV